MEGYCAERYQYCEEEPMPKYEHINDGAQCSGGYGDRAKARAAPRRSIKHKAIAKGIESVAVTSRALHLHPA